MVGSFFKVFLGITVMLIANSEAVKCVAQESFSNLTENHLAIEIFNKLYDFNLNVTNQKNCDHGMCVLILGSGGKPFKIVGCHQFPPDTTLSAARFASVIIGQSQGSALKFKYIVCAQNECNSLSHPNYATTMVNIQKQIEEVGIGRLKGNRTKDLQCYNYGKASTCPGICRLDGISSAQCTTGHKEEVPYFIQAQALAGPDVLDTKIVIRCSADNCNGAGEVAKQIWSKLNETLNVEMKKVVDEGRADIEMSSFSNQPNGVIFFSFFFVVTAMLVANSKALVCDVKGDFSKVTKEIEFANLAFSAIIGSKLDVKNQEKCNKGMCVLILGSGGKQSIEVAGCHELDPGQEIKGVALASVNYGEPHGPSMKYNIIVCGQRRCNTVTDANHETMMNIQKEVDTQVEKLKNTNRSTNLQCYDNGQSSSCAGICVRTSLELQGVCQDSPLTKTKQYVVVAIALATLKANKYSLTISCSTDNCNKLTNEAIRPFNDYDETVEAEMRNVVHGGRVVKDADDIERSQPNDYAVALFTSIILTIVQF